VAPEKIRFVGNTMIDTLLRHIGRAKSLPLPAGLSDGNYAVLTLHRPANVDSDEALHGILGAVGAVADRLPVFFPAHPRTAARLSAASLHPNVIVAQPVSYLPFLGIVARARLVLTDSGGIQEETTVLGVPCITMRNSTERPITCEIGTNILAGTDPDRIRSLALGVLDRASQAGRIPEFWDGKAAERIVDVLLESAAPPARSSAQAL
jgi:UDP-N-acetylglucosamine 2-epimerase (non-hydrolysing)